MTVYDFLTEARRKMSRTTRLKGAADAWAMVRAWQAVRRHDMVRNDLRVISALVGEPDPLTLGEMLAASGGVS